MNQQEVDAYNRKEIREVIKAFKAMDETAIEEAKKVSGALADYALGKIKQAAGTRTIATKVAVRIAQGGKVSKSSKVGEISLGFASQKFSGGATTKDIWGGSEFGSNKYKQFPVWSGREGRGSRGWWIYPTLRSIQPDIVKKWEEGFSEIVKRFD